MLGLCYVIALISGCDFVQSRWIALDDPPPEKPLANLPLALREQNWPDRNGSGSCVIASSIYHLRWHNQLALADYFRRTHAGGQTASSIQEKWRAAGIPFACTERGDPDFLEWCSRNRHGAIIWYFDRHCVHFCGFSVINGVEHALISDNNRIGFFIRIPKQQFIREWRGYGGFACTALLSPAPALPFQGYQVSSR